MIAVSCGIKISAVRHLVLSQSTRVSDGRTDGRTDRITTPKTALAYARAVFLFLFCVLSVCGIFGSVLLVVSICAIDCAERLVSAVTCHVSSEMLLIGSRVAAAKAVVV